MTSRFFFFGLLQDPDILEIVLGRAARLAGQRRARLPDHRLVRMRDETFPLLVPAEGSAVEGIVFEDLEPGEVDRVAFFESIEYRRQAVEVIDQRGQRLAVEIFTACDTSNHDGEPWDLTTWQARDKAAECEETRLWMALYGYLEAAEADRLWDQALAEGRTIADLVQEVRRSARAAS